MTSFIGNKVHWSPEMYYNRTNKPNDRPNINWTKADIYALGLVFLQFSKMHNLDGIIYPRFEETKYDPLKTNVGPYDKK